MIEVALGIPLRRVRNQRGEMVQETAFRSNMQALHLLFDAGARIDKGGPIVYFQV